MSSRDLLYTNKFTTEEYEGEMTNQEKIAFKTQYEERFGVPSDLLNNNDDHLIDYNNIKMENNIEIPKKVIKFQKKKKSITSIDSKDRDETSYSSPNSFRTYLPKKFSNISKLKLVSSEFPNTEQVIRSQPVVKKNNKIYWKNYDDGDIEYSITITDGNYSATKFSTELQSKLNSVERSGADSVGIPHNFSVSVDAITNIFTVKQTLNSIVSNPFSINKDNKILTVKHFDHKYDTGQIINISSSSRVGGLSTSLINTSHLISVDLKRIDSIIWDSTNSQLDFTVGTVNYTQSSGYSSITGEINGKLLLNKGSNSVTGYNTDFTTNSLVDVKKILHIGNYNYVVKTVESDTSMTLVSNALENFNGKDNLIISNVTYDASNAKIRVFMGYIPSTLITRLSSSLSVTIKQYSDDSNLFSGTLELANVFYTYDKYKTANTMYFDIVVSNTTDSNDNDIPDSIDSLMTLMGTNASPKAYLYYTDYINDNIVNFFPSRCIIGNGSVVAGSSTITGNLNNYDINVNFNENLSLIILGGSSVNGFLDDEILTGNVSGATAKVVVQSTSADIANPINVETLLTPYDPSVPSLTLTGSLTYSITTGNATYPPATGSISGITKLRYQINTNKTLASTSIPSGTLTENLFEAPQVTFIQNKQYTLNMNASSITDTNMLKFSLTNNGIHTSGGVEFTHSDIVFNSGSNQYDIVASSSLMSSVGSSRKLYYYSVLNDSVGEYLGKGGYIYFDDDTTNFDNNIGYGSITSSTVVSNTGRIFLNGRFMGAMTSANAGKTVLYAPRHGLTTLSGTVANNYITIYESSSGARVNASGYDYGLITSFQIPSGVGNGNNSDDIRVYSTGIADVLVAGDMVVIRSFDSSIPFVGAFTVNSVVNDGTNSALDYITITAVAVYNGGTGLIYTIDNTDSTKITFFKGSGYVNGGSVHYYHEVTAILDEDHFEIDYPYVGSEMGYWSEIMTSSTSSSKAGCLGGYTLNSYGTDFLTDVAKGDNISIGKENFEVSTIVSDILLTVTSNAVLAYSNYGLFKNVSEHTLNNDENIAYMETKTVFDDRFIDFIANRSSNVVTSTDEENNLLFDSSALTTSTTSTRGVNVTTISGTQFKISSAGDVPNYLKTTDGNITSDIKYYQHNSKYFISLNTAATADAVSKGGDSVSIGKDIKFAFLFSNSDTPGDLLGFPNVGTTTSDDSKTTTVSSGTVIYLNLGDTEFNSVQSNTTKIDTYNVDNSVKGTSQYADYVLITTTATNTYETGDVVYIKNHTGSNNDNAVNSDLGYTIIKSTSSSFYIPVQFTDSNVSTGSSPNGTVSKKQLNKPFVLSGNNYVYLIFKNIDNITTSTKNINNIFAKILLSGSPGSILFNTYISSDKDYFEGLLNNLTYLDVEVRDSNGALFEFNNANFSFSLEVTEIIDIVKGTGISSRTGGEENIIEN